jgi:hypothetical protein
MHHIEWRPKDSDHLQLYDRLCSPGMPIFAVGRMTHGNIWLGATMCSNCAMCGFTHPDPKTLPTTERSSCTLLPGVVSLDPVLTGRTLTPRVAGRMVHMPVSSCH